MLRLLIAFVLVALTGGACGAPGSSVAVPAGRVASTSVRAAGPVVASNILRQDYAGSAACGACHGDIVSQWRRSPMHRMTRLPDGEDGAIRAPFDGRTFRFKGDLAQMEQANGARFVRLRSVVADGPGRLYRVTKVIGGRVREDFAGVEVASMEPGAATIGDSRAELILPISYVFPTQSFRLKGYSVMVGERPGLRAGGVWNQTCIFCHNTVPYFDDLWGALHGPGAPSYQGEVVDRVLPAARRVRYRATDQPALLRALADEVRVLRAPSGSSAAPSFTFQSDDADADTTKAALATAMHEARARFEPRHFIEVGVGCEACHGGSRAHVDDPRVHPTFEPRAPFLSATAADGARATPSAAEWQNRTCARCHQVLFSRYARTWEGGARRSAGDAGGSHITSGEARDFLLGGCGRAMTCTTCHDPHGGGAPDRLARLATPAGNGACTGCHRELAAPVALRAHAHHEPTGAGGSCVACHMPRKNMGLGYNLTRYHRIGSPTDPTRVERDRPLECALCHANKTVGAVLDDIDRLWGKRYDRAVVAGLYGSLEANVLTATIERGWAHEQAAAMGAAGEQRWRPAAVAVARQVGTNAYPLVRYYAAAALAAIEGRPLPADIHGGQGAGSGAAIHSGVPGAAGADADDED